MLVQVQLPKSITVAAEKLPELLALLGDAQLTISAVSTEAVAKKPVNRTKKAKAEWPFEGGQPAATPQQQAEGQPVAETTDTPAANAAAETKKVVEKAKKADKGVVAGAPLAERFGNMVDSNYDTALGLLESFGADRFSAIPAEKLPAFGEALAEAGF